MQEKLRLWHQVVETHFGSIQHRLVLEQVAWPLFTNISTCICVGVME